MKILLVNPPFYRFLGSHYNANSLGIAYIAAYLNDRGHDAWLYNADYIGEKKFRKYDLIHAQENFTNYKEYFKNHTYRMVNIYNAFPVQDTENL